jgi:hypothetical protein
MGPGDVPDPNNASDNLHGGRIQGISGGGAGGGARIKSDPPPPLEKGEFPETAWFNPFPHDRDHALDGIPVLRPAKGAKPGKDEIPRGTHTIGANAGEFKKGVVPPGEVVGPRGCGPCVGLLLIPKDKKKPVYFFHFSGTHRGNSGLDAAGAKDLKGYDAILNGGMGSGGLLWNVRQAVEGRGGTITGYVPGSGVGVDDQGTIYYTDHPTSDLSNIKNYVPNPFKPFPNPDLTPRLYNVPGTAMPMGYGK